jgi:hypothetical protein
VPRRSSAGSGLAPGPEREAGVASRSTVSAHGSPKASRRPGVNPPPGSETKRRLGGRRPGGPRRTAATRSAGLARSASVSAGPSPRSGASRGGSAVWRTTQQFPRRSGAERAPRGPGAARSPRRRAVGPPPPPRRAPAASVREAIARRRHSERTAIFFASSSELFGGIGTGAEHLPTHDDLVGQFAPPASPILLATSLWARSVSCRRVAGPFVGLQQPRRPAPATPRTPPEGETGTCREQAFHLPPGQ